MLFWSLTVRSTNAIISSILCFDFANFVVALRSERNISSRWQSCSIREKQHVWNSSIYEQKRNQRFSSNSDMFFRNCHVSYVIDLLNELAHLFFFVWRKEWKRLSFSRVNDEWLWFDFLTDFFFFSFVFVIFWFFSLFDLRILCIFF